jgi:hypothetical protein
VRTVCPFEEPAEDAPETTRTSDLRFRKPLLYPAELLERKLIFLYTFHPLRASQATPGCPLSQ